MGEQELSKRAEEFFRNAHRQAAQFPSLRGLEAVLQECHERLQQPMRVAIVGLIKAGKSTMMNALLGEAVVATGTVEATFNVNWLRWGKDHSLLVHFKDGRTPEPKSFEELEALTLRADENRDYLLSIKYIEVFHPNTILKTFNLIDTPGLASHYKDDSENTIRFLQLHGKELTEVTRAEASNADAVLYLFSKSIHGADHAMVEQFHMGNPTPVNAIGVLTKVELNWPSVDRRELGP
jgi:predicted GTPase